MSQQLIDDDTRWAQLPEALRLLADAKDDEEAARFPAAVTKYRKCFRLCRALDQIHHHHDALLSIDAESVLCMVRKFATDASDDDELERLLTLVAKAVDSSRSLSADAPFPVDAHPAPRLRLDADPADDGALHAAQAAAIRAELDREGYCVVARAGASSEEELAAARARLWKFLEAVTPMRRGLPETWTDEAFGQVGDPATGIMFGRGFGHSDFLWSLRRRPAVLRAFAAVWSCDESELISSFDGGNVFRPFHYRATAAATSLTAAAASAVPFPIRRTSGGWFHVDQGKTWPAGRQCVQGLVSLTRADETTGGLCVVPRSHLRHAALLQSRHARGDGDFVPVPPPALQELLAGGGGGVSEGSSGDGEPTVRGKLVRCEAGDLVLWDSRTVHCNTPAVVDLRAVVEAAEVAAEEATAVQPAAGAASTTTATAAPPPAAPSSLGLPPTNKLLRVAGYVCMLPRGAADPAALRSRREAYLTGTGTSHWPSKPVRMAHVPADERARLAALSDDEVAAEITLAGAGKADRQLIG